MCSQEANIGSKLIIVLLKYEPPYLIKCIQVRKVKYAWTNYQVHEWILLYYATELVLIKE